MKTAIQTQTINNQADYSVCYIDQTQEILIRKWDDFVVQKKLPPQSCYVWHEHLQNVFKASSFALLALDGQGEVQGFSNLYFSVDSDTLYSCRYGFHAENSDAAQLLQNEIHAICKKYGISKTMITSGSAELNLIGKTGTKDSLYLPINYANEEELWNSIPKKTKNIIRKAEKNGFTITDDWSLLNSFYDIYTNRFLEKSLSLKPIEHFISLKEMFGDDALFIGALQGKELIAGMIFVSRGSIASYVYNASVVNALHNGINNLLMWETMRRLTSRGVEFIDLSESTIDSPVYKFKYRLSRDIDERKTYYYNILNGTDLEKSPMSLKVFLRYKVHGLLHRLMPLMPRFVKKKYLCMKGQSGRII